MPERFFLFVFVQCEVRAVAEAGQAQLFGVVEVGVGAVAHDADVIGHVLLEDDQGAFDAEAIR